MIALRKIARLLKNVYDRVSADCYAVHRRELGVFKFRRCLVERTKARPPKQTRIDVDLGAKSVPVARLEYSGLSGPDSTVNDIIGTKE